ncbi:MAG: dTDP-glucose 4,6-dehydratase [Candidatus Curtissbacteria bacterium GW2011_GWA1_40_24]|uniref:dTDP-glucose 4,6-dehydratase n=1 Tax=Candidatus Curtissbacteria bacterium GW2011_GWA1_40_24 TaxID=1618406 RepID=A0A0G0UYJ7_9BACT|nr:MAG: dTDP-glucose 4,6-dehydratase [Candidatus Curtissbacteria bacterium GW2011_GWA1_40_24]
MSFSPKNILVCGGSGFIGSNFIRYVYNKYSDYKIFNLDLLTYAGNPVNLADVEEKENKKNPTNQRYFFLYGDICDGVLLANIFEKYSFDVVINFAAESHVDRSFVNVFDFIRTNVEGVRSLMEATRKYKISRFIQISTDEIYGSVPEGFSTEDMPLRPSNPYAASKAAADLLVQSYIRTYQIPALIVRGSNNYGPFQYPEKMIPLAISNIIEGKKMPVHGSGEHRRTWIHVNDFCSAIDVVLHKAPDYSIYNASGEEKTNLEIIKIIAQHLKSPENYKEHTKDRPGADLRYAPDSSKLRSELGWLPKCQIESGLRDVIEWYSDNQDWWKTIKNSEAFQSHYQKQSKAEYF